MDLSFGSRLNVLTGDNGLGKSFFLDLIWFAMTREWPQSVNPTLMSGFVARPSSPKTKSAITAVIRVDHQEAKVITRFSADIDRWVFNQSKTVSPGLVFYLMADGSFAVWDSERNHASRNGNELSTAFVFSHREVFNGLSGKGDTKLCNGLITDWAMWSDSFSYAPLLAQQMDAVLKVLSPIGACYQVGVPRRVCVSDARRVPTIKMPYGEEDSEGSEVPVTQASSGIKRIVALAYMLTWAVNEHAEVVKRKGKDMERRVTLLVDDVDSHLNPRWQASIVSSILEAIEVLYKKLGSSVRTQLFMTTHSPIVLASLKDSFDPTMDKRFALYLKEGAVSVRDGA